MAGRPRSWSGPTGPWIFQIVATRRTLSDPRELVDRFEQIMLHAVEKRLRADVPVGSYLSGGVDSGLIAALACHLKGEAINTYTIRVDSPELDELEGANLIARHIGTRPPMVQEFSATDMVNTYPELIEAAEAPVVDTSSAALLLLARRVHAAGQRVVLTGEGADEWLLGYPWYKAAKVMNFCNSLPGLPITDLARRAYFHWKKVPQYPKPFRGELEASIGGPNAWIDTYGMLGALQTALLLRVDAGGDGEEPSLGAICRCPSNAPRDGTRSTAASGSPDG